VARDLPRGPHSLTREQVAESQRRRLLEAMIEQAGTEGYAQTTVTDVIARAGVSRKAFYEHFRGRDDCFMAAYDRLISTDASELEAAASSASSGDDRVESVIAALFATASANPAAVRFVLTEIAAAGADGVERRERHVSSYEDTLRVALGLPEPTGADAEPDPVLRALVGGVTEVLLTRAARRMVRRPRHIVPEVADWISAYRLQPADAAGTSASNGSAPDASRLAGGRAPGSLTPAVNGRRRSLRGDNSSTRSFVTHNQRERILDAIANLSTAQGYTEVAVRDVAKAASVSMDVFYEHFSGKEDAFLCAYELGHARSLAAVERAYRSAADWRTGVRAAIATLFEFLIEEPIFASMALVQAPIATAQTASRARHGFLDYTSMLTDRLEEETPQVARPGAVTLAAIGGGLFELCLTYAVLRRPRTTREIADQATFFALTPFIGAEEAGATAFAS
jgi:AcrR family transcriptional regulator